MSRLRYRKGIFQEAFSQLEKKVWLRRSFVGMNFFSFGREGNGASGSPNQTWIVKITEILFSLYMSHNHSVESRDQGIHYC